MVIVTGRWRLAIALVAKPQIAPSMRRRLNMLAGGAVPPFPGSRVRVELRQRLDALGYISAAPPVRSP
jgi:hypothetical protein